MTLHDTAHTTFDHTVNQAETLSEVTEISEGKVDEIMESKAYDHVAQCIEEVLDLSDYEFAVYHDFDRQETVVMKVLEKGGGR